MYVVKRTEENPVLLPNKDHYWEEFATFNMSSGQGWHYHIRPLSRHLGRRSYQESASDLDYRHRQIERRHTLERQADIHRSRGGVGPVRLRRPAGDFFRRQILYLLYRALEISAGPRRHQGGGGHIERHEEGGRAAFRDAVQCQGHGALSRARERQDSSHLFRPYRFAARRAW